MGAQGAPGRSVSSWGEAGGACVASEGRLAETDLPSGLGGCRVTPLRRPASPGVWLGRTHSAFESGPWFCFGIPTKDAFSCGAQTFVSFISPALTLYLAGSPRAWSCGLATDPGTASPTTHAHIQCKGNKCALRESAH